MSFRFILFEEPLFNSIYNLKCIQHYDILSEIMPYYIYSPRNKNYSMQYKNNLNIIAVFYFIEHNSPKGHYCTYPAKILKSVLQSRDFLKILRTTYFILCFWSYTFDTGSLCLHISFSNQNSIYSYILKWQQSIHRYYKKKKGYTPI